jgi:hypothetical protein
VFANQIEELAILLFDGSNNLNLLLFGQRSEIPVKTLSAHRIGLLKPIAISISMAPVGPRELAIDIGDYSGLRGTWKVIRGDNPIAHRGQRQSLVIAEEVPGPVVMGRAANSDGRAADSSGSYKLPSRESTAILAPSHCFQPRNGFSP